MAVESNVAKLVLEPYQTEALQKAILVKNSLMCLNTGCGKSIISLFLTRYLLKRNLVDKVLIAGTVNAASTFIKEFKNKVHTEVNLIKEIEELQEFLEGGDKVAVFKHSFFESMGFSNPNIKMLKLVVKNQNLRIALIIDEAHELNNIKSINHQAYDNIKFLFDRVTLLTATPYSSCITQIYGLVHLIYPRLWKDLREFKNLFVVEKEVRDWKTGKFKYMEKVSFKNLRLLRETLEPFTYFYYPTVKLNYVDHRTKLDSYEYYNSLCRGLFDQELKETAENKKKEIAESKKNGKK